jgi:uncharacterized delta-60 repeat protein
MIMRTNKNFPPWLGQVAAALLLAGLNFSGRADETNNSTEIYTLTGMPGGAALQPDGKIVIANGSHLLWVDTDAGTLGLDGSGVFRFNTDGTLDRSFHCSIDNIDWVDPEYTHVTSDQSGRFLMSGTFGSADGKARPGYAMFLPDGRLDESFQPWRDFTNPPAKNGVGAGVYCVARLSNGCVSVASTMLNSRFPYPAAHLLDATGRFMAPTNPGPMRAQLPDPLIFKLTPTGVEIGEDRSAQNMSKALLAIFEEVPLELCRYAVRLPDGGFILAVQEAGGSRFMRFDKNWMPDFSYTNHFETGYNSCLSLVLQPDGKLLVGGRISKLNGELFPGLIRLNQDGAIDHDFIFGAGGTIDAPIMGIALQNDGRIVIVGEFSNINGITCPHIARLNSDGSLDQSFQKHFTSYENLVAPRRVKVHSLAAAAAGNGGKTPPNNNSGNAGNYSVQTIVITSLSVVNGMAVLNFEGNPDSTYILQATTNLSRPGWTNVGTNKTDSAGKGVLCDQDAQSHPMRFYRVATP